MVKKLNLKLSFEARSYKWTVFSFFFVLFYIRVMSLPFLANSRWNDRHRYTYWFVTICSYNLSFIFFYLIIINVLFLSHFRIFYCRFHVVECSVINCTNRSETRKHFSSIVYIVVRLKNLKLNETTSFVDLLNYVLSQTLRWNYCENSGTLEKVLLELTSFVIRLITLVLLIQSSSGSMDLQMQYLVLHMHNCKGSLGCFSSSRLKNLSVNDRIWKWDKFGHILLLFKNVSGGLCIPKTHSSFQTPNCIY